MRDREPRIVTSADDDPWQSAQQERALATLWPLLGRHIAFHRRLVDLTANVKAALLLSQSIYWTRHGRDIARTGGWFLKTTEQWEMETGLSAKEQATAREVLRKLAILSEQRVGIPARLHFRLCVDQLGALLSDRIGRASASLDWADGAAVAELLGPSLAYHRTLAGIGGGVHAGLLLSRALHLTRLQMRRQLQEWIGSSADVWTEQIGLTRREQEIARRELVRVGVWEETLVGIPRDDSPESGWIACSRGWRGMNPAMPIALFRRIRQSAVLPQSIVDKKAKQVCGIPTFMFCRKRQN
jgi:hypothetical protein